MKLTEICVRQPVLSLVLSLALVILGLLGFQRLEIRFFPKLELPIVYVNTYYEGASANLMESQVTTLVENALAGIDGIQYISSSSWSSRSSVSVQFFLGGNFEEQAASVRDKVSGIRDKLPPDSNLPTVTVGTKGNPLIGIGFVDHKKSPADIREYILRSVQPVLRQLPGVGSVGVEGSSGYAMRIWLDSAKMAALNVTVSDVKTALTANNIYFPAGAIHTPFHEYSVVSDTRLKDPKDFENIILKRTSAGTIRFKDIGDVELGYSSFYDYPTRIGGKKGVLLVIEPLQSANPIKVAEEVHRALTDIRHTVPPGMQAEITFDMSSFLQSSINETFIAILEAILVVILVVFLFLGSIRSAVIPIVTIPVSLISVFAVINLLGFTINTMSLLGIVLAIGLVVDDAIVMLENIQRHIEAGETPLSAALCGSGEIAFAVIAMSLSLIAVYVPIGFVQGFTATLFQEFAFTLAGAVLISTFIALTLSPMMCSRVLKQETQKGRFAKQVDRIFHRLSFYYRHILRMALKHRHVVVVILFFIAGSGYFIFSHLYSEFIPQEDYGVFNVNISAPTGSNLPYADRYTKEVEKGLRKISEIQNFTTQVGGGWSEIQVVMKPWNQRKRTTENVIKELNRKFEAIPEIDVVASIPDVVDYGEKGSDITLNFMTSGSYRDLLKPINQLISQLKEYSGLLDVQTNLKFDDQEYSITINRDLTADLGVSIQDIADTVSVMMSGLHWTDVQSGNRSYPVLIQMRKEDLKDFEVMSQLYVKGAVGLEHSPLASSNMIPLSSLIQLTPTIGQGTLHHFNRMRSGTITGLVAPGYTESQVMSHILNQLPSVLTSSDIRYAFSGKAQQFIEASGNMTGIMILAFVFIYLVLSAQFGSFLDPFIILFAVPLSLVGALFTLWLGKGTFNLYSQIGLVTLIGMISKHGILITQFVNRLRQEGKPLYEAIEEGAVIRLRPILMTTSAMVFGSLPLALARGTGSVGRHQIGWVIVGGLIFGTFFSLIVVPVAYSYIGRVKGTVASRIRREITRQK